MRYNKGEIYICESEPWKSKVLVFVNEQPLYGYEEVSGKIDSYMSMVCWQVYDEEAFKKKVCDYKGKDTFEEVIKNGNTFPYAYYGEMTYKSWETYIRRHKLIKMNE